VDFFAVLAFAVIILLFFLLFSWQHKGNDDNTRAQFVNKDTNFMLESFLRAPAIGIDSQKSVADIIAEDEAKNDFSRTEQLFDTFYRKIDTIDKYYITNMYLNVKGNHNKQLEILHDTNSGDKSHETMIAHTYISGYDKKIYVEFEIIYIYHE